MEHSNLEREFLQNILTKLEQALIEHQQWHSEILRSITCRLPVNECDIGHAPHNLCRFGQWYNSKDNEVFSEFLEFKSLGEKHKLMHLIATELIIEVQSTGVSSILTYDKFAHALEDMRLELYAFEHKLQNLLFNHDALTGAIARVGILPAFREQQELIKRGVQSCCVVMMDLDHFKLINDGYGHHVGDLVLTSSVHYIIKHLRPYDKIFRYGGEEFLLLMQFTELAEGYCLVERLREGIASLPIDVEGKEPIHITASFGLVSLDPNLPVESSIDRADKAMYMAKNAGRNRVQVGDSVT
ncbi:MAG: diguanylate cyclase [Methylophilus sp.]